MIRALRSIITALTMCPAITAHGTACVVVSDDFSSGSGVLGIINGWEGSGPETKEYNIAASGVLEFLDTGWGLFDSVALSFGNRALADLNDSISVSFDYQTLGTLNNGTGLRVRLYESGTGLFGDGADGYGLNVPSGTETGPVTYRDIVDAAPYSWGSDGANATGSGAALGAGGSFIFSITRTGPDQITLSGSNSVRGAFNPDVRSTTFTNFDSVGFSVGSLAQGLQVDNVQVAFTPGTANNPPSFVVDPILGADATTYVPYSGSIVEAVSDPDGDTLIYSKVSGPAWLNVLADGMLAGAPGSTDIGTNSFTVQVNDGNCGTSTVTLEITVIAASGHVVFSDDFNTGSGAQAGSGVIANGWESAGPEEKVYNTTSSIGTNFVGKLGWSETGAGYFDSMATAFGSTTLSAVGDFIAVSFDYLTTATKSEPVGLRVRLYEQGADLFAASPGAYGLNIPSGTSTANLGYQYLVNTSPYNGGTSTGNAVNGGASYGNGGAVVFTVTKTGTNEITLGGSHGTNIFMPQVAAANLFTFDAFGFSVGSVPHGLEVDNLVVTVPATSTLWNQYVEAKSSGSEPTLPDFSYAGYHHGEAAIPTVDWAVFDVTAYGAVANDGLSDKAAINAAISAAESNGSGVVFFPPGRFRINEPVVPWTNDPILVEGSRIVFRGSGRGGGGTELFANRHMDPNDPAKIWSCPPVIQFRGYGDRPGTASDVVAAARRETHSVTVANASIFRVADWVQLHRLDNSPPAVAEAVAPYSVDPDWTTLINTGVAVDEHHLIESIVGNTITFKEPIHSDVTSTGNWSVVLFDGLEEVGVEAIAFTGNWISNFVHHASFYDDSGWSALQFNHTVNSWVRNCRFTDWSACISVSDSAAVSLTDIKLDGNKGHSALTLNNSAHCFVGMIDDTANHHHACGVAGKCSGNVFWKCEYSADTCYESHASQPRHTLFDNISGGWMYGRWGGALQNQPNHLENLVFWNYNNTGAGVPGLFEFMRSASVYGRIIMPYVVGFHGNPQEFDQSMIAVLESNGTAVEPASLYEAQYKLRRGKPLTQLFYDEWTARYGLTGLEAVFEADPDTDSRVNLAEYAIGGIPIPGTNSLSELPDFGLIDEGGAPEMEYVFWRRRNAADLGLAYAVEFAESLLTHAWSTNGVSEIGAAVINDDFEAITNRVPTAGTTNGFVRLRVELGQ